MVSETDIVNACKSAGFDTKILGRTDVVCSKSRKEIFLDANNISSISPKGESLIIQHSKFPFMQLQFGEKVRLIG